MLLTLLDAVRFFFGRATSPGPPTPAPCCRHCTCGVTKPSHSGYLWGKSLVHANGSCLAPHLPLLFLIAGMIGASERPLNGQPHIVKTAEYVALPVLLSGFCSQDTPLLRVWWGRPSITGPPPRCRLGSAPPAGVWVHYVPVGSLFIFWGLLSEGLEVPVGKMQFPIFLCVFTPCVLLPQLP